MRMSQWIDCRGLEIKPSDAGEKSNENGILTKPFPNFREV